MGKDRTGYETWEICELLRVAQASIARAELANRTGQGWRFVDSQLREARIMVHEVWRRGTQLELWDRYYD